MKQPFDAEINDVLKHLMDKLFYIVMPLGFIAVTVSIFRAINYGWYLGITVDIIAFSAMIVFLALRRRLPAATTFRALMVAVAITGAGTLLSLGLAGTGLTVMATLTVLIGIFYGIRPGIAVMSIALLCIFAYRGAISLGLLPYPSIDADLLLRSPLTWATQALTSAAYTVAAILAAHSVQQRLMRSLTELNERTGELQDTVFRLKESEEKYRLLSENISDLVVVQDMEMKLVYASPSIEKLFGYRFDEAVNQSMKDWLTPESLQRAFTNFQKYHALAQVGPVSVPLMEYVYIRKDGSTFPGELCTVFLYDHDNRIIGSQSILRDITERRKNEEERRRLEEQVCQNEKMRIIGQLAGGVAHDFNNQLAGILGFADLIRQHSQAPEIIRQYAESIITSSHRSADLTLKLLSFAHRGKIRSEPVDMHILIGETVSILERSVDKRICIRQQLGAPEHVVPGDATELQNALLNICLNARDAMPVGGELTISTARILNDRHERDPDGALLPSGAYLQIRIVDTGHGIGAEAMAHIFEPFFSTKERGKGTGMGLPAVSGTLRSHKGTISIDSAPGKGTAVTMLLPVTSHAVVHEYQHPAPVVTPRATGCIMVIDDEPIVLKVAKLILERLGFTVLSFDNQLDAIDLYREQGAGIDLVIVDMIMPRMNGLAVLSELYAINHDVRAIIYSGYNFDNRMEQLKHIRALGFVRKPFDSTELAAEVSRILEVKIPRKQVE